MFISINGSFLHILYFFDVHPLTETHGQCSNYRY